MLVPLMRDDTEPNLSKDELVPIFRMYLIGKLLFFSTLCIYKSVVNHKKRPED